MVERECAYLTAMDLLQLKFPADPHMSPDGEAVACTVHRVLPENDSYAADIFVYDVERERLDRFTRGDGRDVHPRWSPDGRLLAFLSDREINGDSCGRQLWMIPSGGGEALPVTRVEGGVNGYLWSPEGDRVAVTGRVDPEEGFRPVSDADEDDDGDMEKLFSKYNRDVRHIRDIKYKADGEGFLQGKRGAVGVVDLDWDALVRGEMPDIRMVTSGPYDHTAPCWSPDGEWLAVSACREEDADVQRFSDIWVFAATGEGDARKITRSTGPASAPSWSPDGETIAYLGNEREIGGGYDNMRLWLADVRGLAEDEEEFCLTDLTSGHDVSFGDSSITDARFAGPTPPLTWESDGSRIYHLVSERGTTQVVGVEIASGHPSLHTAGDFVIYNAHIRPDLGRAAVTCADPGDPGMVGLVDIGSELMAAGTYADEVLEGPAQGGWQLLYAPNRPLLAERHVFTAERFAARAGEDAPQLDGWMILPEDRGDDVPCILQIHGGPMAMYTGAFFFEFQLLAAAGYAVTFTNPRGSSGYGEDFRAAIEPGWGNLDYADLMALVDAALQRFACLDERHLGVAGGSYGGYMTNWIIGHTDRFRAAVTMRCVSNLYSFWGTSDIGFLWDERYDGHPWEVPENYRQQSPITHMDNVSTPTLVVHSEEDHRCPVEQGEQVFATLKKQGVETEFIRYPGESHGLSRGGGPWHRVHRLRSIREWFDRFM